MGGLVAQLLWRRHPERISRLVLCASSRNFLGTPAERMVSLFAPAVTAAARMNPLLFSLGAGMMASSLVNGLDGEQRQFALTEMNRTSVTTVTAALVAVSNFTSHDWIGQIDVPVSALATTRDTTVPPARQRRLAEAIPHATVFTVEGDHGVCINDPARFSAKLLEACLGAQTAHRLSRSAVDEMPGEPEPLHRSNSTTSPQSRGPFRRRPYNQRSSRRANRGCTNQVISAVVAITMNATRGNQPQTRCDTGCRTRLRHNLQHENDSGRDDEHLPPRWRGRGAPRQLEPRLEPGDMMDLRRRHHLLPLGKQLRSDRRRLPVSESRCRAEPVDNVPVVADVTRSQQTGAEETVEFRCGPGQFLGPVLELDLHPRGGPAAQPGQ